MLFFAVMIGLAERSVLTMAITRMVHIPNQNVNESTISSQSFCAAPKWAVDEGDGSVIIDQAVSVFNCIAICLFANQSLACIFDLFIWCVRFMCVILFVYIAIWRQI